MYREINLSCFSAIKELSIQYLKEQWDFKSEKIIRVGASHEIHKILSKEFAEMGLPSMIGCSLFCRGPKNTQVLHCDSMSSGEKVNNAIIIPILGTEGSKFQWFGEDGLKVIKSSTTDKKSIFYYAVFDHIKNPNPISELEILEPIIANVRTPHRAISSETSARVVLSIKFEGNPTLL